MGNSNNHIKSQYIDGIHKKTSRMYLILTTRVTRQIIIEINKHIFNPIMSDNLYEEIDLSNEVTPAELARMSNIRTPQFTGHKSNVINGEDVGITNWLLRKKIAKSPESAIKLLVIF